MNWPRTGSAWRRLRNMGAQRGLAENIDAIVMIPIMFLILVAFGLAWAQVGKMSSATDNAAAAAARAAGRADTKDEAQQRAQDAAGVAMSSRCSPLVVDVDVSEFGSHRPGDAVRVTVRCTFPLTPLLGVADKTVTRVAASPLDPFREGQ